MKNREILQIVLLCLVLGAAASGVCFYINIRCGIICAVLAIVLMIIFVVYTKRRYDTISQLNDYLSLVCSGNFDLDVPSNSEGELSILKNNLYKVIILLRSSNDELKKDKIYLADSLADISHQLKTPLTSLMVITDLVKNEEDKSKRDHFVDIIESQCEKMKWLITTLLKLSKLDSGTADLKNEELSIESIIHNSIKPFLITLDLKEINLITNINDFTFYGDRNWSIEAIENIIKNCIEHTNQGGTLEISTSSTTIFNQITIKDSGCGIAKADLPHVFERFYHGKNSSSDSVGIGLALSKAILQNQKADITVSSEENVGSEFVIKFYKAIV